MKHLPGPGGTESSKQAPEEDGIFLWIWGSQRMVLGVRVWGPEGSDPEWISVGSALAEEGGGTVVVWGCATGHSWVGTS